MQGEEGLLLLTLVNSYGPAESFQWPIRLETFFGDNLRLTSLEIWRSEVAESDSNHLIETEKHSATPAQATGANYVWFFSPVTVFGY